ncbi:hypothetical protein TCAL_10310 [Tigriopus californicus]|uniref:Ras-related protein Rab n=1 Tax=Tigriopus californicus TaxID=6832 RepID=A0A553NZK2_TIGCA|nr:hypothetical protein TCAL_10310 [Tigriopus californicus]
MDKKLSSQTMSDPSAILAGTSAVENEAPEAIKPSPVEKKSRIPRNPFLRFRALSKSVRRQDLPIKDPNTSVVELAPREKGDGSSSSLGDHPERAHRDLWHGHPDVETGSTAEITPENDSESLDDAFHTYTELGVDEWMEPIQTVEKIEMDTLATESGPNQYQAQTSEMEVENASTAEALVAEGGSGTDEVEHRQPKWGNTTHKRLTASRRISLQSVADYPLVTRECLFKVLLIGDPGVGKTSFVQRYTNNIFRTDYKGTVGVDFALKVLRVNRDMTVKLQLWDVAGQERFTWMTRVYYRDSRGCIVMFDLSNRKSFLSVAKWKRDLDAKCSMPDGSPVPCLLLANKCDLRERHVTIDEIEQLYNELNFIGWTETSAKGDTMVKDSVKYLIDTMLKYEEKKDTLGRQTSPIQDDPKAFKLTGEAAAKSGFNPAYCLFC